MRGDGGGHERTVHPRCRHGTHRPRSLAPRRRLQLQRRAAQPSAPGALGARMSLIPCSANCSRWWIRRASRRCCPAWWPSSTTPVVRILPALSSVLLLHTVFLRWRASRRGFVLSSMARRAGACAVQQVRQGRALSVSWTDGAPQPRARGLDPSSHDCAMAQPHRCTLAVHAPGGRARGGGGLFGA